MKPSTPPKEANYEMVDEKNCLGEEGVVFKIDFEKTYDHVE